MTRRGTSLVELLVILSMASAVITTSAHIVHRLMRAEMQTRYYFENERAVQRLARQFRADVHGAVDDSLPFTTVGDSPARDDKESAAPFLTLRLAGSAEEQNGPLIEYRRTSTGIQRSATREGRPPAREDFAVATVARIELDEQPSPRRLVLTITVDPADLVPKLGERAPTVRDAPINMQVVAVIGRDARFAPAPLVADASDASASHAAAREDAP